MEQTTTLDDNYKICVRCGQRFNGLGYTCNTTGCMVMRTTKITEFSPCEPWVVKKPIKVKITQVTTGLPFYLE